MGSPDQSVAERLAKVVVSTRQDLVVTRDVFNGNPSYIVRDPISLQAHNLKPADYELFCALDGERPLKEIFIDLVGQGRLRSEDSEAFYRFILTLHQRGLLLLPISDDKALYRRHRTKIRAKTKQRLVGFLFLQVPLLSPDVFLTRTVEWFRPMFTRGAFLLWCLWMGLGGWIIFSRFEELQSPLTAILDADNIPLIWASLVILKVIHEMGHAYACKAFGGVVPEMGMILIVGTPCAYVDASAAWGFTRRRHRIIVSLAGMYWESIVAVGGLVVWAATPPSLANTIAYQVFLLGSVVTLAFNLNPLMRFDGYYVFSDLLGIPNLRARAADQTRRLFDRIFLGLRQSGGSDAAKLRGILVGYGISSAIYKVFLVMGICLMIALKSYYLGLTLAAFYLVTTVGGMLKKGFKHLVLSPATATVRARAVLVGVLLAMALPLGLSFIPITRTLESRGHVGRELEVAARTRAAGRLESLSLQPGEATQEGSSIARLANADIQGRVDEAEAQVAVADLQRTTLEVVDGSAGRAAAMRLEQHHRVLARHRSDLAALEVPSPATGVVLTALDDREIGRHLPAGSQLALIGSGRWIVTLLLDSEELTETGITVGDRLLCRSLARSEVDLEGTVIALAPAGSRVIDEESMTHFGGGEIVVDAEQRQSAQAWFEVTLALDGATEAELRHGMTVRARLATERKPLFVVARRRLLKFLDDLRTR